MARPRCAGHDRPSESIPSEIIDIRDIIGIIDTCDTLGAFHLGPSGIFKILSAFDIRARTTSTWSSPHHLGIAATSPLTPSISASTPLFRHQGPRRPGPRRPSSCPGHPRYCRHCYSETTYLVTTRRHGSGEFPRHHCTASSCLGSITTAVRSPCPLPCLCSAPPRKPCALQPCHRTFTNVSRHGTPLPLCAPIASSRISAASRRRKRKMQRTTRQVLEWFSKQRDSRN